jgi:hypothetical protein
MALKKESASEDNLSLAGEEMEYAELSEMDLFVKAQQPTLYLRARPIMFWRKKAFECHSRAEYIDGEYQRLQLEVNKFQAYVNKETETMRQLREELHLARVQAKHPTNVSQTTDDSGAVHRQDCVVEIGGTLPRDITLPANYVVGQTVEVTVRSKNGISFSIKSLINFLLREIYEKSPRGSQNQRQNQGQNQRGQIHWPKRPGRHGGVDRRTRL